MTLLIKGMEMPMVCDDCWALDEYGDYPRCRITEEQRGYNFRIREQRMEHCPLVEVPTPHGRLIDINDVKNTKFTVENINQYERWWNGALDSVIENAPTVIEAEEG